MSLYIHIPFCKQACTYCDFHFSVSQDYIQSMVEAILMELELQKNFLPHKNLSSIYFGGGTPSLLGARQLNTIFDKIESLFTFSGDCEITLEANPDDLTPSKIKALKNTPVNRLSIGVQSFFDDDLRFMNRAHNAQMAVQSVLDAAFAGYSNLTIDLIYGLPGMDDNKWKSNLEQAFKLPVNHLSCYCLTVEKKTVLDQLIRKKTIQPLSDSAAANHFTLLMSESVSQGFTHYEISNFGKPGFFSRHNCSYWSHAPYLGVGPSAHSFDGNSRQWNVSSNRQYMSAIEKGNLPFDREWLTKENKFNEFVMTGLRTMWGVDAVTMINRFGHAFADGFEKTSGAFVARGDMQFENGRYILTAQGKLVADGIASAFFKV